MKATYDVAVALLVIGIVYLMLDIGIYFYKKNKRNKKNKDEDNFLKFL